MGNRKLVPRGDGPYVQLLLIRCAAVTNENGLRCAGARYHEEVMVDGQIPHVFGTGNSVAQSNLNRGTI